MAVVGPWLTLSAFPRRQRKKRLLAPENRPIDIENILYISNLATILAHRSAVEFCAVLALQTGVGSGLAVEFSRALTSCFVGII